MAPGRGLRSPEGPLAPLVVVKSPLVQQHASPADAAAKEAQDERRRAPGARAEPPAPRPRAVPPLAAAAAPEEPKDDKVSKIIKAFSAFDANGDGTMDRAELARLCWSLNVGFTDLEMEALLDKVDANGDGVIQYAEFIQWLMGDDSALSRLQPPPQSATARSIRLHARTLDGKRCVIQAAPDEAVHHLRLRVCHGLRLPTKKYDELKLLVGEAGSEEAVAEGATAGELQGQELLVVFATVGAVFGVAGDRVLRFRVDRLRTELTIEAAEVQCLTYVPSAGALCAVCGTSTLKAWDATTGDALWQTTTACAVHAAQGSRGGGASLLVGTADGIVTARQARTGAELWKAPALNVDDGIEALFVPPPSTGAACGATDSGKVLCWAADSGALRWQRQHGAREVEVRHLVGALREEAAFRDAIFSGSSDGLVCAWSLKSGDLLWTFQGGESLQSLCYRELHDTLTVAAAGRLTTLDGRSGEQLAEQAEAEARFVRGRREQIFVAAGATLEAWDTSSGLKRWQVDVTRAGAVASKEQQHGRPSLVAPGVGSLATARDPGEPRRSRLLPALPRASLRANSAPGGKRGSCSVGRATPQDPRLARVAARHASGRASPASKAGILALAYAFEEDVVCVGTPQGLLLFDGKTGATRGSQTFEGGVRVLEYSPPPEPE